MSPNPHSITRYLETALSDYADAPYAVAVTSCTAALLLAVEWCLQRHRATAMDADVLAVLPERLPVEIPRRTYVSVPQSIIRAGGSVTFRNERWSGAYELKPLRVWDSARWLTSGLYPKLAGHRGGFVCVSFHASKTLGDTQGGAILHDSPEADEWLRRARFDGRTEGVHPSKDHFDMIGHHCYLSPDVAARLLWKLSALPKHNKPLPNDKYPDLSRFPIFRSHT